MKKRDDETAIEFLRRVVDALDNEYESILSELKTVQAVLDFAELWTVYDTDYLTGIFDCIEEGADPKPLNDFIAKHGVSWRCPDATNRDEE